MPLSIKELPRWQERWRQASPEQILQESVKLFGAEKLAFATALGMEGIVILHCLYRTGLHRSIEVFLLDTGLLFPETYELLRTVEQRWQICIRRYKGLSLEQQRTVFGDRLWVRNPDMCCFLRKVLPLRRALSGKDAWITSIRREQSPTRQHTECIEWDVRNSLYKINPLAYWTWEQVRTYVREHDLPYNPLHDRGYPSIGCMPCTTPVREGEDWRAGRWRGLAKLECGIHQ